MVYKPSSTTIASIANAKYQYNESSGTTAFTAGVELEFPTLSGAIHAPTVETTYPWFRYRMCVFGTTDTHVIYDWFLIRTEDDAVSPPDLSDEAVIEALQKDKQILARGYVRQAGKTATPKVVQIEKYNVVIPANEQLMFAVRPFYSNADLKLVDTIEFRRAGDQ